ncbi:hypothetical protein BSU04_00145 [Caballeronia sordidicola]|uniref:Uncharacterized protein n=1 Tax=Caballeronia sordidicola TaxID=196367 RepID=A0A226XB97_CABSO|nr:hypothetical protein BSU04_00145 [Caballeronia sordidicola]
MPHGVPDHPARFFFVTAPDVTFRNPIIKAIVNPTNHCN